LLPFSVFPNGKFAHTANYQKK